MEALLRMTMSPQFSSITSPGKTIGLRSPTSSRRALFKTTPKDQLIRAKTKNLNIDLRSLFCVATRLMSQSNGLTSDAKRVQSEGTTTREGSVEQLATEVDGHDTHAYLLILLDKVENLEKLATILAETTNEKYANLHAFVKKAIEDLNASIDKVLSQAKTKVTFDDKLEYFEVNDETQTSQRRRSARISNLVKIPIPVSKRASCGAINDDTAAYGDNLKNRRRSCKPDLLLNKDKHSIVRPKRKPNPSSSMVERIDENGNRIIECAKCSKTFPTTTGYSQHFRGNPH